MSIQQLELLCGACSQLVKVFVSAEPRLVNMDVVSMVVIAHPKQAICACGATLQVAIVAVPQMVLGLVPVPKTAESPLIVPPQAGLIRQ